MLHRFTFRKVVTILPAVFSLTQHHTFRAECFPTIASVANVGTVWQLLSFLRAVLGLGKRVWEDAGGSVVIVGCGV